MLRPGEVRWWEGCKVTIKAFVDGLTSVGRPLFSAESATMTLKVSVGLFNFIGPCN